MDVDGLAHDVAHRHAGVQAGIGVLEHDLHLAAVRQHVHGRLFAEFRLAAFVQHRGSVLVVQRHISAVKQRFAVIEDTAFRRLVQAQQRPVVVFPQPDSPTSPNVSPLLMANETSSTA